MTSSHEVMVGIDVSKDKLDVAVTGYSVSQVNNTFVAFRGWLRRLLKKHRVSRVVFEATGGYEKWLILALEELEIPFARVHGTAVHHFIKARGQLGKTDAQDAVALLEYAGWMNEKTFKEGSVSTSSLKLQEWHARLRQLKQQYRSEKNRLKATLLDNDIMVDIRRHVKQLEKQIDRCKEKLVALIKAHCSMKEEYRRLQTMPGVGHEVAMAWLCYGQGLTNGQRASASAFCGLAPLNRDSGKYKGHRSTGHGQPVLKQMIYMAALVGIRYNPPLREFYEGFIKEGRPPLVALIACARKLLMWLRAMMRDQIDWQEMDVYKQSIKKA